MKVTISKILTPIVKLYGEETRCSALTKREVVKEMFLDPWANEYQQRAFFREFTIEIGHVLDENTTCLEVIPDVMYTINGVGHFHQDGIAFGKEIDNYHLCDKATYEGIVSRYTRGLKIDNTPYKGSYQTRARMRSLKDKEYRKVQHTGARFRSAANYFTKGN